MNIIPKKLILRIINAKSIGKSIALVSDAGCQAFVIREKILLKNVKANGINVICIPGPCAAITAIITSGCHHQNSLLKGFFQEKVSKRANSYRYQQK